MARTAKTTLAIKNAGTTLGTGFDTLNLISGISAVDSGGGVAGVTASGGGAGTNVATEVLTATQSGSNITLDLTGLAHTFTAVEVVFRNGQAIKPTTDWSISVSTVTVLNADASEVFMIQYTY